MLAALLFCVSEWASIECIGAMPAQEVTLSRGFAIVICDMRPVTGVTAERALKR